MKNQRGGDVRFVILSDTHECHRLLSVPRGDVLVHAGDFLMMNALFGREASVQKIEDFNDWLGTGPQRKICYMWKSRYWRSVPRKRKACGNV